MTPTSPAPDPQPASPAGPRTGSHPGARPGEPRAEDHAGDRAEDRTEAVGAARATPGSPEYRRVTRALFVAGLATFATLHATQPLLPLLVHDFGVSPAESALSLSVTTLALGIALLVVGPTSEVLGRTRVMTISLFGSAAVGLACAVAPTWPLLLVLRGLVGLAVAGLPAVAVAYLREEIHPAAMASATGLYIGGTAIGGMSGRLLAGALADVGGWRLALAGIGAMAFACACYVRAVLPPSRHFVPVPPDHAVLWAMTRRVLSDPVLLALYALPFVTMGAFVACYNALGFRLAASPYSLSVGVAGLVFCCYALGSVSSARAGRLADRFGHRAVVPAALVIMLAGLLITLTGPLALVVAGVAVFTIGFFACHGVASGWVAARAAAGGPGAGQASALYTVAYYVGASLAGTAAGAAWSGWHWPGAVALCGALVVVGLALALWLRTTTPLHEPPAAPDIAVS